MAREKVSVNFKLDLEVRDGMKEVCDAFGITLSAAFQMFAAQVWRERRLPLSVAEALEDSPQVRYAVVRIDPDDGD